MKQALKNFGLGLVYFFLLPIFLILAALVGVYALGVIIYNVVKGLIRFFKGDKFFEPLSEDLKVKEIKDRQAELAIQQNQPQEQPAQPDNRVYIQQNYYQQPQPNPQPQPQQPYVQQPNVPPYQQQPYQNSINQQPNYYNQIPNTQPSPTPIAQNPTPTPIPTSGEIPTQSEPHEVHKFIDISNDDQGGDNL